MRDMRIVPLYLFIAVFAGLSCGHALAQSYPAKPIRMIVPYATTRCASLPGELATFFADETKRWAPVVKASGAKVD